MPQTNAERQRAWRARHRGEPRGNPAMQALLAALQARLAQVEVEMSFMPSVEPRASSGRLLEAYTAVRAERDELAEQLAVIEAFEPGIAEKARQWMQQMDRITAAVTTATLPAAGRHTDQHPRDAPVRPNGLGADAGGSAGDY